MGYDKLSSPGPARYYPRRTARGGAVGIGDAPGAYSVTKHGFSMGGAPKDYSVREAGRSGPWLAHGREQDAVKRSFIEGGLRLHDRVPCAQPGQPHCTTLGGRVLHADHVPKQVDSMGKCLHTTPLPASLFQGDNFTEHRCTGERTKP